MIRPLRTLSVIACVAVLTACRTPLPESAETKPVVSPTSIAEKTSAPAKPKAAEITSLSFDQLYLLHQNDRVLLFDSRLPLIHRLGHIPGSINMPLHQCEERIRSMAPQIESALKQGKIIVTYCSGPDCPDSHKLARHFADLGYPASVFTGGWQAWSAIE